MCGFFASVKGSVSTSRRDRIFDQLRERGPDDRGHWSSDRAPVHMVHCRLRIQPEQAGVHQPLVKNGSALVFNGELYNQQELRDELRGAGASFEGESDTEVALEALRAWGAEAFDRFRGMFAIVYWDEKQKKILAGRDALGQKPLYYTKTDESGIELGSRISPLLDEAGRKLDPASLSWYLSLGYVPSPRTAFFDVKAVPPGHYLVWEDGQLRDQVRYWDPVDRVNSKSDEVYDSNQLQTRLRTSVRRRATHGPPPAVWLSGGIDSSLLLKLLVEETGETVTTYSVGFKDEQYDERSLAREWAEQLGCDHREARVEPKLEQRIPQLARAFGNPFADSSAVPTSVLAELTAENEKVTLSGDGGDELFGGYRRYRAMRLLNRLSLITPGFISRFVSNIGAGIPISNRRSLWGELVRVARILGKPRSEQYLGMVGLGGDDYKEKLGIGPLEAPARRGGEQWLGRWFRRFEDVGDAARQTMLVDLMSYLPEDLLVKADVSSMMHSLECRAPFLDRDMVDWRLKLIDRDGSGLLGKEWLRKAFSDQLTEQHWNRPKKGFGVPLRKWFLEGKESEYLTEKLTAPHEEMDRLVDREQRKKIYERLEIGTEDQSGLMWALVMMRVWMEEYEVRV